MMMTPPATKPAPAQSLPLFLLIVAGLTAVRLIGLRFSVVDLYVDEAQYWSWSRELAFGYFSKPPLIAWVIAAGEAACGSGEACIRSAAPLFYLGTSLLVYATGRALYDDRTAFWAGLLTIAAPALVFSARIITTDVPLLFFWALALLAFVRLRAGGDWRWAVVLAAAFGLGLLSKYAMAYFVPGILAAALVDRRSAALFRRPALWLALAGGLALLLPNILWNIDHGLITIRHVGDNAGSRLVFDPLEGLEFLAAQFAVAGPVVFAVLVALIVRLPSAGLRPEDRMLTAFAVPPLAIVVVVAFLGSSNANWAVTAYISAFVVAAAVLVRGDRRRLLTASLAIGALVQSVLLVTDTLADRLTIPGPLGGDAYRRTMGGAALGRQVAEIADASGTSTILAERRNDIAALLYYLRDTGRTIRSWPSRGPRPTNHFQLTRPLAGISDGPILVVTLCPDAARFAAGFATVDRVAQFIVPTGPTSSLAYHAFRLAGARGPAAPPGPCP